MTKETRSQNSEKNARKSTSGFNYEKLEYTKKYSIATALKTGYNNHG